MQDLSYAELRDVAGDVAMNLIRRCSDGSLRMWNVRWRLADVDDAAVVFRSVSPDPETLELPVSEVERITWDRLPKQQERSQLRFHLTSGDLWTFSGRLTDPPAR